MYDAFRNEFISECSKQPNLPKESINTAVKCLDCVSDNYTISPKENKLVPYNCVNARLLRFYLASKLVEGYSEKTLKEKWYSLKMFLETLNKPLSSISTMDVRNYLYQYKTKRQVSNVTLDQLRLCILSFFKWAQDEEYIDTNPILRIANIKYEIKQRQSLTPIELEYLRRACKSKRELAVVDVLFSTGCRCSELCGIKLSDINWDTNSILVYGKGKKYRTVFLNSNAIISVTDYLEERKQAEAEGGIFTEYLFSSVHKANFGDIYPQLKTSGVLKLIRKIASRIPNKLSCKVFPHIIRHTTATLALRNGMPINVVREMLGHEKLDTTLIYAKASLDEVKYYHSKCVN